MAGTRSIRGSEIFVRGRPSQVVSLNERSPGTTKVVEVISRECTGRTCKMTTVGDSTFTANYHVWSGKLDNRLHVCEHWVARQQKMEAFVRGSHARLGAASQVSRLDDAMLFLIAGEVLGDLLVEKVGNWIQAEDCQTPPPQPPPPPAARSVTHPAGQQAPVLK